MSTYASDSRNSTQFPLFGFLVCLALVVAAIVFIALALDRHSSAQDARAAASDQQMLTKFHKMGFTRLADGDFYESSYWGGPTAFTYRVGTSCKIEFIIDGSGAAARPYIWLSGVENSKLYITNYAKLRQIPQTATCFS